MTPSAAAPAPVADGEPPPLSRTPAPNHQLLFKKHKNLPRPRKDASYASLRASRPRGAQRGHDLALVASTTSSSTGASLDDTSATSSHHSSPHIIKQYPKSIGNGPDLPPTPPAHSRNSSATYSVLPSSATYVQSPDRSAEDVQLKLGLPTTPMKQMSPPTPDVTPPQALQSEIRPKGPPLRPPLRDRNLSKNTSDSRTASFRTAREHPSSSSDDEGVQVALQPVLVSEKASESTVRRLGNGDGEPTKKHQPKVVGLGLGLESSPDNSLTPKSKRNFGSFDGEWGTGSEELVKEWDKNLSRNVVDGYNRAQKRTTTGPISPREEVIESVTVAPTNATEALRVMSLPQRILTFPSPNESGNRAVSHGQQPKQQQPPKRNQQREQTQRRPLATAAPIIADMAPSSDSLTSDKGRRVSTVSSKSTVSTVVEAALLGTPPQRQRTLRHVKKQVGLRDSSLDLSSPSSSTATSLLNEANRQRRPNSGRFNSSGHDSVVSTTTINSISSRSARREIWKAGGIPVVVVPSRMSSVRSNSQEPSLRSTGSRRSKRSQSLSSAPISQFSKSREISPNLDQHSRRGRTCSDSGGSVRDGSAPGDQRTIDFPPVVPRRTSSLSAPTSRNASRSGSLTAESIHAHSAILGAHRNDQERAQMSGAVHEANRANVEATNPLEVRVRETAQVSKADRADRTKPVNDVSEHHIVLLPETRTIQDSLADATILTRLKDYEERHEQAHNNEYEGGYGDGNNYDNRNFLDPRSSLDRHADLNSARHLSPHNTPFSMLSIETSTTHHSQAEVSEALAVSIYPHQNTSVLVVDHSNRPSDCSDDSQRDRLTDCTETSTQMQESSPASELTSGVGPSLIKAPVKPQITTSDYDSGAKNDMPITPSQQLFSLDDVDSPLRNPRNPPEPPAINFIPATPSGLTPAAEREQTRGNYFEEIETNSSRPRRRSVSLVLRRALSRGRSNNTEYGPSASRSGGLLTRTLSLTGDVTRRARSIRRSDSVDRGKGLSFDDEPEEEDKLHPFWRPSSSHRYGGSAFSEVAGDEEGEVYRYPPVDNRPHPPRRSLSSRMKRTFAILPLDNADDFYPASRDGAPERRTVRRTPSGNLRVVKHHGSIESFGDSSAAEDHRPYTAPEHRVRKFQFWRSGKARDNHGHHETANGGAEAGGGEKRAAKILPNIGDKIGEYGPHTIPRRFSERRREKRSNELRRMISGPQEVRDGVGEVIRRTNYRDTYA